MNVGRLRIDTGISAPPARLLGVETPAVIVIGAGLAGLVAANALADQGRACIVLDKASTPGGRLATRRLVGLDQRTARLDHGAQFFTVRSPDFAEVVHGWRRAGLVREWCLGFGSGGDGHPRYCAEAGMNTVAKFLASSVDLSCDSTVHSVSRRNGLLQVTMTNGDALVGDSVILTPPVPQSLALLDNGELVLPADVAHELGAISYARCLALLVTLHSPSTVPDPGGVQLGVDDHPLFSFVGDNEMKGISDVPAVTFHVHDEPSQHLWDAPDAQAVLLEAARPWLGDGTVVASELKKWRYARPITASVATHVGVESTDGTRLVFAGDAFAGAKMEGAALSGLAAAEYLAG